MKKRYLAIPILAIALHFLLSNLLYFLVERLVLDVFHIPPQQFMKHSYWGEILIYAVLILVFFTLYKLLWRKDISEPRTATNFKDVLGSLVVGFGICGISGLWIMLAEQLPSLQKSVEAMNAGAENIAGGNAFGTFMIAVIAAPVVEEILFRGIVLRSMRHQYSRSGSGGIPCQRTRELFRRSDFGNCTVPHCQRPEAGGA